MDERRRLAAWSRRREAGRSELLAALGRDPVGRPGVVEHDLDLRLGAELRDPLRHLRAHHLQSRAAEESRRELDMHVPALDPHLAHHSEVDDRDHRDLRVGHRGQRLPDLGLGYHVVPAGWERRTEVISSHNAFSSGEPPFRRSTRGPSSSSAAW